MMRKAVLNIQTVSGLRMRYFPKSRIGHGFVSVAPWLDMALIAVFFLMLEGAFILQPGVVMELPEAPFTGGLSSDLVAVVLSLETGQPGRREEIVFFDDTRFLLREPEQMARLQEALRRRGGKNPSSGLILEADLWVRNGTMVKLLDIARQAGIRQVSVATKANGAGM